jgi:uncharacterized protein (TIGR02099 family)
LNIALFGITGKKLSAGTLFRGLVTSTTWLYRVALGLVVATLFVIAVTVLALRYWFLPNIENYREDIARAASAATKQHITIGRIDAAWQGLHPLLKLEQIVIHDKQGGRAIELQRVDSTLSWLSLPALRPHFRSLELVGPVLDVKRDSRGRISIKGIDIAGDDSEDAGKGGMADWLLAQRDIAVTGAKINWTDEQRGAPMLSLRSVDIRMVNRGNRHRFGLRAVPPAELAGPLDMRGDMRGQLARNWLDWSGNLYVHFEYADIAAWLAWMPFPVQFPRGTGALEAWATIKARGLTALTADVKLNDVKTKLGADLPELNLARLSGRLAWKKSDKGYELSASKLSYKTVGSQVLEPASFALRISTNKDGKAAAGEMTVGDLNLAPLLSLVDHLPIEAEMRRRLVDFAPRGRVRDVAVKWVGNWPRPAHYSVRGHFHELSLVRQGDIPGFRGVSGNIDGNEGGGTLNFNAKAMQLDFPNVFAAPLDFDTFTAQASWTRRLREFEIKLASVSYANADLAGTLSGSYQRIPEQPGIIDITGKLTRADARKVANYIPLRVAKGARPWLSNAFLAGVSNDVNFRAKGNLRNFPFPDNKQGVFYVTAKVSGGKLHYGDGWPDIENIEGDLAFRGTRMDVNARSGTIFGVTLSKVTAQIPRFNQDGETLIINGEADGPTADFLRYIAASPVSDYIDNFTKDMQSKGPGKLTLQLELPFAQKGKTKVTGVYQMTDNRLVVDAGVPALEQVSGRVEFTEAGVRLPSATATFFGGPLTISGVTQPDATIKLDLRGRIAPDAVRRAGGPAWLTHIRGAADWTGSLTFVKKSANLVLESDLRGIASTLPAPFLKVASAVVPVRLERRVVSRARDNISFSYGKVLSARFDRTNDGKHSTIERGRVQLGGGVAGEPEQLGVWISGSLDKVDIDDWLLLSGRRSGSAVGNIDYTIGGAEVNLAEVDVFDRKFHDLALRAVPQGGAMQLTLAGREIEGSANWSPQGKGRLTARLKKLIVPAAETKPSTSPDKTDEAEKLNKRNKPMGDDDTPDLPAVDVIADYFQLATKRLGRLELRATPQERDWRIDQLKISNADGELTVDGVWQSWLTHPRTRVSLNWNIKDMGKTLVRLGHSQGMRGGVAKLAGSLSWTGSPQQFDVPSLSGNLAVYMTKGQFMKMEPGIAKLLGILSLQALPRRITLDFRDVFSDGFAFDDLIGSLKIERGAANVEGFRMRGPSAQVAMSGVVDLARETQDLQVKVRPQLSTGVAIVGAIAAGPIVGIAAWVAQKLLKDPFDELVSFHYKVTGTWTDPVVTKVGAPRAANESSE